MELKIAAAPTLFAQARHKPFRRLVFEVEPGFCIWIFETGRFRLLLSANWGDADFVARVFWDDLDYGRDVSVSGSVRVDRQRQWHLKLHSVGGPRMLFERIGGWDGVEQRIVWAFASGVFERPPFSEEREEHSKRLKRLMLHQLPIYQ